MLRTFIFRLYGDVRGTMAKISDRAVKLLNLLVGFGTLEKVYPGMLKEISKEGVICLTCSDGDQMFDLYLHLVRVYFEAWCHSQSKWLRFLLFWPFFAAFMVRNFFAPRIHLFALNGGAMLLSPDWPTPEEAIVLKRHIIKALKLKRIATIFLYAHVPCGAAAECNLTEWDVLDRLAKAKDVVKELEADPEVQGLFKVYGKEKFQVQCFVHVHWQDGRKRTYHIRRKAWRDFCATYAEDSSLFAA